MQEMTRREACLILGLREGTPDDKIKEAHRRIMIANHPDAGLWESKLWPKRFDRRIVLTEICTGH